MTHVLKRGNRYYFNRRIPDQFKEHDPRNFIRIALRTDSRSQALRMAAMHNEYFESYWRSLALANKKHGDIDYEHIVNHAQLMGFNYIPIDQLCIQPLGQIMPRLQLLQQGHPQQADARALLGAVSKPRIRLDEALNRFWDYSKGKTLNKSPNQLRKWQYARVNAINNFAVVVGNKPIDEISRDDILKFRDWWIMRIQKEGYVPNSANKNLIHLKVALETVSDNLKLDIDIAALFKKILLDDPDEQKRLPFDTDYIVNTLLKPENLEGLNEQAKWALYAIAETGAGESEQVGLLPEDIILDADIPHIIIRPRQKHGLKTRYRKRVIPLVGFALEAFKACPNGFTDYVDAPDRLSADLGKHMRKNNLYPTKKHTIYSLRHSFQDRLLAVNAPDRVQADLMGHKFNRQAYGNGASLEQKLEWLQKIQLKF